MSFDSFDKSSKPLIANEDLEQAKFKKTSVERIAVRICAEDTDPVPVTILGDVSAASQLEYNEANAVPNGALTTVVTYTVPVAKTFIVSQVQVAGSNKAIYQLEIDGIVKSKIRTYFTQLNGQFSLGNFDIVAGQVVRVRVIHESTTVGDFNATIIGELS